MKNIKKFSESFISEESISLNGLRMSYKRGKEIASRIISAFKQEGRETADMMKVFNNHLRSKLKLDHRGDTPTPEEVKNALEQLKDIPKLAPYALILLSSPIPFSTVMYTAVSIYLKKITNGHIDLLPGSFNNIFIKDSPANQIIEKENNSLINHYSDNYRNDI